MLISKKDLLAMSGISYGQLYRWKRAGLIPDEWFIKQSSYTGQETFFPREQILSRIQSVQELKDKYSIEELARMFNPEVGERTYGEEDLQKIEEIDKELLPSYLEAFGKKDFLYTELVLMVVISEAKAELGMTLEQVASMARGIKGTVQNMKSTDVTLGFVGIGGEYYLIMYDDKAKFYLDERMDIVKEVVMDNVAGRIMLRYQEELEIK